MTKESRKSGRGAQSLRLALFTDGTPSLAVFLIKCLLLCCCGRNRTRTFISQLYSFISLILNSCRFIFLCEVDVFHRIVRGPVTGSSPPLLSTCATGNRAETPCPRSCASSSFKQRSVLSLVLCLGPQKAGADGHEKTNILILQMSKMRKLRLRDVSDLASVRNRESCEEDSPIGLDNCVPMETRAVTKGGKGTYLVSSVYFLDIKRNGLGPV